MGGVKKNGGKVGTKNLSEGAKQENRGKQVLFAMSNPLCRTRSMVIKLGRGEANSNLGRSDLGVNFSEQGGGRRDKRSEIGGGDLGKRGWGKSEGGGLLE